MPSTSKGCEASPVLKEKGCQEAIAMAAKFQNPRRSEQNNTVGIQDDASSSRSTTQRQGVTSSKKDNKRGREYYNNFSEKPKEREK